jgi:hypothetical protein
LTLLCRKKAAASHISRSAGMQKKPAGTISGSQALKQQLYLNGEFHPG